MIGLRTFDAPLPVYTHAVRFDEEIFRRLSGFPDGGFERGVHGARRARHPCSGQYALEARNDASEPRNLTSDCGPITLRGSAGYVFGGFLRREAEGSGAVSMTLQTLDAKYVCRTAPIRQSEPSWELVWACAAPGEGRFILRVIQAEDLRDGSVYADDVFFCPVEPLMRMAREQPE
jgi:hypothetical protein